jgi:hypothetical protein
MYIDIWLSLILGIIIYQYSQFYAAHMLHYYVYFQQLGRAF